MQRVHRGQAVSRFWSQRNGFSGHEWAFSADTCRYVPADDVTRRLAPLFILQPHSPQNKHGPAKPIGPDSPRPSATHQLTACSAQSASKIAGLKSRPATWPFRPPVLLFAISELHRGWEGIHQAGPGRASGQNLQPVPGRRPRSPAKWTPYALHEVCGMDSHISGKGPPCGIFWSGPLSDYAAGTRATCNQSDEARHSRIKAISGISGIPPIKQ